jgi:RHS repeat-associated protein
VRTTYTYEPFGAASATGQSNTNPYQYTGRENDGTGLDYYRARYYSPARQRFISEDPIQFAGGDVNLYAYVANNPVNGTDPTGLIGLNCQLDVAPVVGTIALAGRKSVIDWSRASYLLAAGPSELGRCLDACAAGGEVWRRYCNSLPAYPLGLKRGCWAVALMGEVACRGYCFRYWGR